MSRDRVSFFVMSQVVHYDLPRDTEAFLHRSGRTGRAGKKVLHTFLL